jgi:hypothetical protein
MVNPKNKVAPETSYGFLRQLPKPFKIALRTP